MKTRDVVNSSGQSALAYRVGTHSSFKAAMAAALGRQAALAGLTARKDDDPSIAALDAWATVLDVLTFYQERIANEGYVRTATETRSVLELARAIGYELNPGVAAGVHLAFTVDAFEGSPAVVAIDAGVKVQSVPGQDELPQIFETTEDVEARPEWNALRPQAVEQTEPTTGSTTIYLEGISTALKPGDALLFVGDERVLDPESERWDVRRVKTVTAVPPRVPGQSPDAGLTIVELDRGLATSKREPPTKNVKVYAFRLRAGLFGHNAPDWLVMSGTIKRAYGSDGSSTQWPKFNIAYEDDAPEVVARVHLDAAYPGVADGSWIAFAAGDDIAIAAVKKVTEGSKTEFTLTGRTTALTLDLGLSKPFTTSLRQIVVYAVSELLEWGEAPIAVSVSGTRVPLDREVEGLAAGRLLIASGLDALTGEPCAEVIALARADIHGGRTTLVFTTALQHAYQRESMTLFANVAGATHGETRTEILGSGDGSKSFQRFTLKQAPLTYVSAATASGSRTTLEVRVNDVLWEEVPALYAIGASDRVYVTRLADDGAVTVEFGDGVTGARLPSGMENVTARYRVGSGLAGLVETGQASLLMTRPLGLTSATNPVPSSGAADPEALDEARSNAPLTVLTMERIVSLQDHEDFVRAFAGVGKARAELLWNGERQVVHVTVAAAGGGAVDPTSDLHANLIAATAAARHSSHEILIDSYLPRLFNLDAKVLVDDRYVASVVVEAVRAALEQAFSFERRLFGQPVTRSEVLGVMQGVEGVIAVDLDALHIADAPRRLAVTLQASRAHWAIDTVVPAELLTVNPGGIVLAEMS